MILLKSFKRMVPELERTLRENVYALTLQKGQGLQEPATLNNNIYFIEKGLLYYFMLKGNRKETLRFGVEDQFVVTTDTVYDPKEGDGIESLAECTFW